MKLLGVLSVIAGLSLSLSASAQQIISQSPGEWRPVHVPVTVDRGSDGQTQRFEVDVPFVQTTIYRTRVLAEPEHEEFAGMKDEVVASQVICNGPLGRGQSAAWDKFYSAKADQKAKALSDAIYGVGPKSAKALVAAGYFAKKPRSWEAFSSEINSAAANGVIDKNIPTLVLGKFASQNLENLGYATGDCKIVTTTQSVAQYVVVPDRYDVIDTPSERTLTSNHRVVNVKFNHPAVQSFEQEQFDLVIGNDQGDIRLNDVKRYTRYSAQRDQYNPSVIVMDGQGRDIGNVPPPSLNELVTWAGLVSIGDGKIALQVNLNPRYFRPETGNVTIHLTYKAEQKTGGAFSSYKPLPSYSTREEDLQKQDGNQVQIWGVNFPSKVRVQYALSLRGSSLFDGRNTEFSGAMEIDNKK